jgi:hypothetical protein
MIAGSLLLPESPSIAEWQTLLSVQAEAAATLTGLVFVAASINLTRIIAVPGLPSRAAESIFQFLQVFFICTAALIPRQTMKALAFEILGFTLLSWAVQIVGHVRYARSRSGHPRWWLILRVAQTQLATVPFFIAAVCLWLSVPSALYWLIPGFVLSFMAGVANTWVLLIEILR